MGMVGKDETFREIQLESAREHYKEQPSVQIRLSERYLRHPPITHPLNVVDDELQSRFVTNECRIYLGLGSISQNTWYCIFYV